MFRLFLVQILLFAFSTSVSAATWYSFNHVFNEKTMYFFDADTVVKNGDLVTIWTKYVKNKKYPDSDGSYSTAQKVEFSCKKRTNRYFSSSIYDKNGDFIKSFNEDGKSSDILPGSLGEGILDAVCSKDFPKSKSKELYYPVVGNNVIQDADNYYRIQEDRKTDLAPISNVKWNVFKYAFNSDSMYFFDANTVTNNTDKVTVWIKYVNNENSPPEKDGSYSTASKIEVTCSNNTVQYLRSSMYNKDRQFIKSAIEIGDKTIAKEGTILSGIVSAVCTKDFPNSTTEKEYFSLDNNDIYQFASNYYNSQKAASNDPAPK